MEKPFTLLCAVLVLFLVACAGESDSPCYKVEGTCLYLHCDNEGCTLVACAGESDHPCYDVDEVFTNKDAPKIKSIKSGPVTLHLLNESREIVNVFLSRTPEDIYTNTQLLESVGIETGESHTLEVVLEAGYFYFLGAREPHQGHSWGLTVKD
jgi:hypothetical protein